MSQHHDLIRHFEDTANAAMPCLEVHPYEGWQRRISNGYTKRANSVHPLSEITMPLAQAIADCEAFYQAHNLPCIFKMTEASTPATLDDALSERGYALMSPTLMQVCPLTARVDAELHGSPHLTQDWLTTYQTIDPVPPAFHQTLADMLSAVAFPTWYAALKDETGRMIAVGTGVQQGPLVGLFNIVVEASQRGHGLGRQIVRILLTWAQQQGAQQAYLQVSADNTPAIQLYQSLGFETLYRYWYRVLNV